MKVGFYTVFRKDPQHYVLSEILVRSIRAAMPGVPIAHFTDETSPIVHGVDAVLRKPHGPMLERRLEHYASMEGDWLLLDTDVVVRRDVRDVFDQSFDVALTNRHWPHLPSTPEFDAAMPFNTGVCFSRSAAFWQTVLETWRSYPDDQRDWLSEQRAVASVVASHRFHVVELDGAIYNYPPATPSDHNESAAIVHYKGQRKDWMRKLWIAEVPACA